MKNNSLSKKEEERAFEVLKTLAPELWSKYENLRLLNSINTKEHGEKATKEFEVEIKNKIKFSMYLAQQFSQALEELKELD
ncbi:MAG: hypothetical protein F6K54_29920 [Okeania sp. SIO3B5]|uniref:hypothetical protein n=1 Tax=Okeania sp. SIO3B5 TaxID=2607811 RepID=UPI0013FEA303|nr:hypothetical protein [Okeania sp. SIO3B5]NEO56920.1 hypothetical protein [Okeania sp. SIO3B5]